MTFFDIVLSPGVFFSIIIIASLYVIFKAADLLVFGISRYAKKLGMSDATSGILVVAMAASLPEIISSFMGVKLANLGVALGAILGTNMVHAVFVLGIVLIVGKQTSLNSEIMSNTLWFIYPLLMLPLFLLLDGRLGRIDGALLLVAFCVYLWRVWRTEGKQGKMHNVKARRLVKDGFIFTGTLIAILLSGRWLAFSTIQLSSLFNIPSYFLAITIMGIGTAIPDFAVNIKSVFQKHTEIGIGEVIGSVAIELLLYFGLLGVFYPFSFTSRAIWSTIPFLMAGLTALVWFAHKKRVTWKHGIGLVLLYAIFVGTQIILRNG